MCDPYIDRLVRLSNSFPLLSWVYLLTLLRYTTQKDKNEAQLTLSRSGFSPNSSKFLHPRSTHLKKCKHILFSAQKDSLDLTHSIINVYNKAEGIEIDTLNLLYANLLIGKSRRGWLKFFNNYLRLRSGWSITLGEQNSENLFRDFSVNSDFSFNNQDILVTVIMPTFNNADTLPYAVNSVLAQTHKNIELIIVDDCSSDATEDVCKSIVSSDSRVKYFRNRENLGAYVCRNRGLGVSNGKYITVQDADDWSFPQRISHQLSRFLEKKALKAHLGYYLRIRANGEFSSFRTCGGFSYDGALHKCLASLMLEAGFFKKSLGFWDSVRFGADSELYSRVMKICGSSGIVEEKIPLLLALDRDESLTTSASSRIGSHARAVYADNFAQWHQNPFNNLFIDFPLSKRPFPAPEIMLCAGLSNLE